jgi:hypothetical protein
MEKKMTNSIMRYVEPKTKVMGCDLSWYGSLWWNLPIRV